MKMENGRQLSKHVENTVGKGEIARYKQFLLFPQCFQKAHFQGESKGVIVWEWVKVDLIRPSLNLFFYNLSDAHWNIKVHVNIPNESDRLSILRDTRLL